MTLIRVTQKYGPGICILDHFALLFWVVVVVGLLFFWRGFRLCCSYNVHLCDQIARLEYVCIRRACVLCQWCDVRLFSFNSHRCFSDSPVKPCNEGRYLAFCSVFAVAVSQ